MPSFHRQPTEIPSTDAAIPTGAWRLFRSILPIGPKFSDALLHFARQWGEPIPARRGGDVVDILRPHDRSEARPHTLSSTYGLNAFPFHNDTVHWTTPSRYLCLACVDPGKGRRTTSLVSLAPILALNGLADQIGEGVFLIRSGRHSFYSSIASRGRPWLRYDPGCMMPTSSRALDSWGQMQNVIESRSPVQIQWQEGDLLVLDNWTVLHRRGEAVQPDPTRRLARVLLK